MRTCVFPNNAHHRTSSPERNLMAAQHATERAQVYAVIGGGIAGVSCAEEVSVGSLAGQTRV